VLKITTEAKPEATRIKLEGKLAGPWVGELERAWRSAAEGRPAAEIILDLSDVTFIDAEGRKLMAWICRQGARFHTSGCMTRWIVEQIQKDCASLPDEAGCASKDAR
jgi:hypothetical protein